MDACTGSCLHASSRTHRPPRVRTRPGLRRSPALPAGRIHGRALIFWDPKDPTGTRKLDAIDTDQITPAADCVSESLETLDERWKAGSFRHLMPDFRQRVHSGATFVVAGDRFAIGSSREMSPAGLKGVAEEAGLELVIVCGNNMGDIFRRNSFNLGLHVVQSPEAVADARDGDELQLRSGDARPAERNAAEGLHAGAALSQGRRDPAGRRDLRNRPARARRLDTDNARGRLGRRGRRPAHDDDRADLWAHRVDKSLEPGELTPGTTLRVYADLLPASDGTAPFSIHTFNQITGGRTIDPRQAAIANDHFVFTGIEADERQTSIGRAFARVHGLERPYYATPGDGIFHFYFPEQGLVMPGQFIPGADSHSRAYGAYGAVGIGVGSTTLGFGWSTGYIYVTLPKQRRVTVRGAAPAVGERQGHRAGAAAPMGRAAVAGHVGGARGWRPPAADGLPEHHREHDGRGRGVERHLRARRHHLRLVRAEGHRGPAVPAHRARARTRSTR